MLTILRSEYGLAIHPLETKWKTTAEAVLEAIDQSSDLTQRGIRGILAEATFRTLIVPQWSPRWAQVPVLGDGAFDVMLRDATGDVRIQVKLQRREKGIPKLFKGGSGTYVVETQRTRNGTRTDAVAGTKPQATRPYRVDEFDVLAVCLQPLTGDWRDFIYCAVVDLITRPADPELLAVMQPIQTEDSPFWSHDIEHAIRRALPQRS